ncbi:MAG: hypothetical protein O6761_03875 [Thaumarchaeota archaeon]|nr:hypothetical protein [Nitrososphaerota archaeon]
MFIFLLPIGLTDPINNVFADEHVNNINATATPSLFDQVSTHPLVLLLVGGIVSSLLVTWITRYWQARSESFKTKSELITKINKSSTKLIVALEYNTRKETFDEESIHEVFREWRETSAEIGAMVRANWNAIDDVDDNPVVEEWNAYFEVVKDLYNIVLKINMDNVGIKKKKSKIYDYLIKNTKDKKLEYDTKKCEPVLENFFKAVKNQEPKDIGRCMAELLFYVDKRKYYLLTLIFKEPIISYESFFKFKKWPPKTLMSKN